MADDGNVRSRVFPCRLHDGRDQGLRLVCQHRAAGFEVKHETDRQRRLSGQRPGEVLLDFLFLYPKGLFRFAGKPRGGSGLAQEGFGLCAADGYFSRRTIRVFHQNNIRFGR